MRLSFVGHPLASVLFVSTLAIWFVIELRQGLNRRIESKDTDRGSLSILRASAVAVKVTATAFTYNPVIFGISLLGLSEDRQRSLNRGQVRSSSRWRSRRE